MQTTVNDKLVELGTLVNNKDNAIQRDGADLITEVLPITYRRRQRWRQCACSPVSNRYTSA
jgi:hypothetical protein